MIFLLILTSKLFYLLLIYNIMLLDDMLNTINIAINNHHNVRSLIFNKCPSFNDIR